MLFGSGLVAPAAPGSIIAVLTATAPGSHVGVILSVIFSATVTFLITAVILRATRKRDLASADAEFAAAVAQTEANKGKQSTVLGGLRANAEADGEAAATPAAHVRSVVFACDAGMGSSAMGASVLRKKLEKAGVTGVTVVNKSIANLDGSEDLIITHQDLTARAKEGNDRAIHVSIDNFMNSPKYDEVVASLSAAQQK